VFLNRQ